MRLYIKIAILFLTLLLLYSCGTQRTTSDSFSAKIEDGTLMITKANISKIDKKLLASDSLRNVIIPTKNRRFRAFQTDMERVDMTDLARRKGSDCDSLHISVFYS